MSSDKSTIWPPHEAFYLQGMLFNSSSALESIDRVTDVMEALDGRSEDEIRSISDPRTLLDELQNVVLQAGALSRYFWPIRRKPHHTVRGERLRWAFSIDDTSPLCSRNLRDSLEHFDERLDDYLKSGIVGVILPEYVGMRPLEEQIPYHVFRAYYLDDGTFSLLGEEHSIPPIVDEVLRIHEHLNSLADSGGRLRPPDVSPTPTAESPNER